MDKIRPFVYVASAYTKGDVAINTNFQCKVFSQLMADKKVWPFVPLWSHFQHAIDPRPYQDWVDWDNAIIPRLDACVRLVATYEPMNYSQAESAGADAEVELFKFLGKPVFYSIEDLYKWVDEN